MPDPQWNWLAPPPSNRGCCSCGHDAWRHWLSPIGDGCEGQRCACTCERYSPTLITRLRSHVAVVLVLTGIGLYLAVIPLLLIVGKPDAGWWRVVVAVAVGAAVVAWATAAHEQTQRRGRR